MTTLNDDSKVNEQTQVEGQDKGAQTNQALSPETSAGHDDQHGETGRFQQRINQVTAEKYGYKRELDAKNSELEQANKRIQELESGNSNNQSESALATLSEQPQLPDDLYDDEAMRKYHQDMMNYSSQRHNPDLIQQQVKQQLEQQQQAAQQQAWQAERDKKYNKYFETGVAAGIPAEKLDQASNFVGSNIGDQHLIEHLLNDPDGAKIVNHLADNQADMYELKSMLGNPYEASAKLNQIKQKALSQVPNTTRAPEPTPSFSGGSAGTLDDGFEIL